MTEKTTARKIKIFIIAGEPSGDVLGGKLMVALKKQNPSIEFVGIGGSKMAEQGLQSIFAIDELSLMGFAEVVPHIPRLLKRIKQTAQNIIDCNSDLVITVDAPDFCFRVIKRLLAHPLAKNIKKVHLIAPSVWAYRAGRAQKIAKIYDLLLAILPFEPPYFEKYGLKTVFIGHPIVENSPISADNNFRQKHQISQNELLICVTPGSRIGEVKRILPEIAAAVNILVKKYPNLVVAIPTITKTNDLVKVSASLFVSKVIVVGEEEKYQLFHSANIAIAKSGTNTLEIALAKLPMVVVYKVNFLTHFFAKMLIKIKFANLINLILNEPLIPELLQNDCRGDKIAAAVDNLISNPDLSSKQVAESHNVLKILGLNSSVTSSDKAASEIISLL